MRVAVSRQRIRFFLSQMVTEAVVFEWTWIKSAYSGVVMSSTSSTLLAFSLPLPLSLCSCFSSFEVLASACSASCPFSRCVSWEPDLCVSASA